MRNRSRNLPRAVLLFLRAGACLALALFSLAAHAEANTCVCKQIPHVVHTPKCKPTPAPAVCTPRVCTPLVCPQLVCPQPPGPAPKPGPEPKPAAQPQPQPGNRDAPTSKPSGVPAVSAVRDGWFIDVLCFVAALMVPYPIVRYLRRQWEFRRDRIFGMLGGDSVVLYYLQFRRESPVVKENSLVDHAGIRLEPPYAKHVQQSCMAQFTNDFGRWYGRGYYVAPLLLLLLLAIATAWWASGVLHGWSSLGEVPDTTRALVMSSLAGAFMWVISDELDRLRRRDFTTSDVYYYVFRILISVPFAWALGKTRIGAEQTLLTLPVAIPVAFFLGAFPTHTLFTLARRFVSQTLKLGDDQKTGDLELEKLQSVGKSNAERFQDEDVNTITGLAYSDPIDLTIRTNFDLNYVVDCVSQALMWIYFGDESKEMFSLSLRGAQEIHALHSWATTPVQPGKPNAPTQNQQDQANQALKAAAAKLGMDPTAFLATISQIAEDPYTIFLRDIWR